MKQGRWGLSAMAFLAFLLRAYRLDFQSIWTDEGFVAALASRSLPDLLAVWNISPEESYASLSRLGTDLVGLAAETDIHPPLYYFLVHFWTLLAGRSEYALRFPAVFFGVLMVPLLFVLGKRILGWRAALVATGVSVLSPFYLDFSQQVRMYTLATLLAVLSMYSFQRAFQEGRRCWWVVHALSTALALYTHYFALTVVLAQAMLVLVGMARGRGADRLGLWLASQAGALLMLAPWVPFAMRQVFDYRNRSLLSPDWQTVLPRTWQVFNLGLSVDASRMGPVGLAILAVFTIGLALAWWRGSSRVRPALLLLLLYFLFPLLVGLAIFRFKPMFHPKYFMMASPAYYLLLGAALYGLWRSLRWGALLPGVLVFASLVYATHSYYFDARLWKDDTRAVAGYLEERAGSQDLVLSDLAEPLGYYYKGKAPAYYLPGEEETAPQRLASLSHGGARVFLLHYEHAYTDAQGLIPFLLEREGEKLGEKGFRGYTVKEYRLRQGPDFAMAQGAFGPGAVFEDKLVLEGWRAGAAGESKEAAATPKVSWNGNVWVLLAWRLEAPAAADYKASLSFLDARGHVAAQSDRTILRGMDPTSRWLPGERARNFYILPVFSGVAPGEYRLRLRVYEEIAAPPGPEVRFLGDEVALGKVTVTAPSGGSEIRPQDMGTPSRVQLGPVDGLGYTLPKRQYRPGETMALTLFFRPAEVLDRDYQFVFELRDGQGVARWTGQASPLYPTSLWRKGDGIRDWQDLPVVGRLPPGDYRLWMGLASPVGAAPELPWDLGPVKVLERPRIFATPPVSHPLKADLGGKVALLGYDLEGESRPGGTLRLSIYWRALRPMDESYTVFAHLLDGQNRIWAQHDGIPAGDSPTSGWLEGEVVVDKHVMRVREDALPGQYVLEVGMYDAGTGRRLDVVASEARVVGGAIWVTEVTLK